MCTAFYFLCISNLNQAVLCDSCEHYRICWLPLASLNHIASNSAPKKNAAVARCCHGLSLCLWSVSKDLSSDLFIGLWLSTVHTCVCACLCITSTCNCPSFLLRSVVSSPELIFLWKSSSASSNSFWAWSRNQHIKEQRKGLRVSNSI